MRVRNTFRVGNGRSWGEWNLCVHVVGMGTTCIARARIDYVKGGINATSDASKHPRSCFGLWCIA
jgi:hypothetical protein